MSNTDTATPATGPIGTTRFMVASDGPFKATLVVEVEGYQFDYDTGEIEWTEWVVVEGSTNTLTVGDRVSPRESDLVPVVSVNWSKIPGRVAA